MENKEPSKDMIKPLLNESTEQDENEDTDMVMDDKQEQIENVKKLEVRAHRKQDPQITASFLSDKSAGYTYF